jgi:uncharacterized repeat protein (TIGR01451 family)
LFAACVVVGVLAVWVASAGGATTAISSFTKTGVDETTGSTATPDRPGETAPGHTLHWVLSYRNATGGDASVNISDRIGANQTFVHGSLRSPPDLVREWSTDAGASYVRTEPPSGVDSVRATGVNGPGSTGSRSPVPPPARGFSAGTSNGDGWEPLFIGENVYNVHHHDGPNTSLTMLDCHDKSTGRACPGYPAVGSYVGAAAGTPFSTGPDTLGTAYAPNADVDPVNGHIYFPVGVDGKDSIGVLCADVLTNKSCGYTQLGTSPIPNRTESGEWHAAIDGGAVIANHYYLIDTQANVYCFDTSTHAACGAPYPLKAVPGYLTSATLRTTLDSRLQAFDGRYVLANISQANGSRDLSCVDASTNSLCAGFPVRGYATDYIIAGGATQFNAVLAPILDAAANVTGVCGLAATNATSAPFKCYAVPGGTSVPTPWPQQVPGSTVTRAGLGSITNVGTKLYFPYSNETGGFKATYACWNFATGGPCTGFVQASSGANVRAYTVRQDPDNPGCLWELGDAGVFEVFSATFGGTTCNEGGAVTKVTPGAYYCDGKPGHVQGWRNLVLEGVGATDYNQVAVSILDANGNPVPGWTDRLFPSTQQSIDISSIPYAGSTKTLQIALSVNWGTHTPKAAAVVATFAGAPVQVCFKTVVGPASCTEDQSISNHAKAVTDGGTGFSDAPAGNESGEATFLERPEPTTDGCQADLSITKAASYPRVPPGGQVMYTLVVRNHGPDTATDARVSDAIPRGLEVQSAVPDQGKCTTAETVDCSLGTIPSGGAVEILLTATVSGLATDSIENCATVSAFQADPDPGNNGDCKTVTIAPSSSSITADIQILDLVDHHKATPGEPLTDALEVTDNGPDTAPDVTVTDTSSLPLDVLSIQPAQGTCTRTEPFTCHLGSIAVGHTVKIRIRSIPRGLGTEVDSAIATSGCTKSGLCDLNTHPAADESRATTRIIRLPSPPPPRVTG